MNYKVALLFPNGDEMQNIDFSYCDAPFKIGELVFFEDEKAQYRVADVQHQLRRVTGSISPAKQIMVCVILKKERRPRG